MAKEKKIDCVILGLLSHQSMTGYEIKKWMDGALKYFWGASYGSIYPSLSELEKNEEVISKKTVENGRDKVRYTITEKGQKHLKDWLCKLGAKNELRYETLLKLYFGSEAGPKISRVHIEEFEEQIQKDLVVLKQFEQVLEPVMWEEDAHLYYLITVRFGIRTYEGYLAWCKEAKELLLKKENV